MVDGLIKCPRIFTLYLYTPVCTPTQLCDVSHQEGKSVSHDWMQVNFLIYFGWKTTLELIMFNSKSTSQEAFHALNCSPETLTAVEIGQAGWLAGGTEARWQKDPSSQPRPTWGNQLPDSQITDCKYLSTPCEPRWPKDS